MRKTTIYLPEDKAEALRRLASITGRSQADLIREGIRRVTQEVPPRVFHSMGRGSSAAPGPAHWNPAELYEKRLGRRP